MKQVNVGLLGFGLSGRVFHAPILTSVEGYHLSKIFVRDPEKKEQASFLYPDAILVDTIEAILDDNSIDLIILSLPNTLHYEMAQRSLIAGKHVVVEKPFTNTTEEATALIHTSKEENKLLSIYQNRRFDGDFMTLKKVLESGKLGNIKEFESHFDRFRPEANSKKWRESILPGSGILFDLGSHLIDQALALFGMPVSLYADIRAQREGALVDDCFELILYYNDLKVTLKSSMLVKETTPRFIVHGDKGSFIKYGLDPQEDELKQDLRPDEWMDWGVEESKNYGVINFQEDGLNYRGVIETLPGDYRKYYENLYEAIVNGAPLEVTAQQAGNVIKIIELAKESSLKKCRIFTN